MSKKLVEREAWFPIGLPHKRENRVKIGNPAPRAGRDKYQIFRWIENRKTWATKPYYSELKYFERGKYKTYVEVK